MTSKKPFRMWIDGKSFCIIGDKNYSISMLKKTTTQIAVSEMNETVVEKEYSINSLEDGTFSTTFRLPWFYYHQLLSFVKFNVADLQDETSTKLSIPETDSHITVSGSAEQNIVHARNYIHWAVAQIRSTQRPKQFISIPTISEEIKRNFGIFKEKLLNEESIPGLEESVFQSPQKLHATLAVCALMDDVEEAEAVAALSACKEEIIDPILLKSGPVKIRIADLNCMESNLRKVNVLYAHMRPVDHADETIIQTIADGIYNYFYERGLVIQANRGDSVKLHVTLINTKYRKSKDRNIIRKRWNREPIDARTIMDKYSGYFFGEIMFDNVKLSYISTLGEDGYYKTMANIVLDERK